MCIPVNRVTVGQAIMKSAVFCGIIFSFLQLQVQSAALKHLLVPLDPEQEECITELNLDREMMAYFSTQEFPPENNSNFNDFFSCTWKKQAYQGQDGQLNYRALEMMLFDALKEQTGSSRSALKLVKEMAFTAVADCHLVRGNSHGQTAVKTQNCMYRTLLRLANIYRHLRRSETYKAA